LFEYILKVIAIATILIGFFLEQTTMTVKLSKAHNLAWRKFLTAHVRLLEQIESDLAQANLPPLSWYDVLFALSEAAEQKLRLHELAEAVLISRSNLTRLVDRLEVAGLIQREQCPSDRRGAFAVVTEAGLEMRDRMWTVYGEGIKSYFARHLDPSEVKFLVKILNRMTTAKNAASEPPKLDFLPQSTR
jgi:DNA-binding MarR family transcriptional regulator